MWETFGAGRKGRHVPFWQDVAVFKSCHLVVLSCVPPCRLVATRTTCAAHVEHPWHDKRTSQLTAAACTGNKKQKGASHKTMVRTQRSGMRQRSVQDLACGFPFLHISPLFRIKSHKPDARGPVWQLVRPLREHPWAQPGSTTRGTCPGLESLDWVRLVYYGDETAIWRCVRPKIQAHGILPAHGV